MVDIREEQEEDAHLVVGHGHGADAILAVLEGDAAAEQQARNAHRRHSSACHGHPVLVKLPVHLQPSQSDPNVGR